MLYYGGGSGGCSGGIGNGGGCGYELHGGVSRGGGGVIVVLNLFVVVTVMERWQWW